MGDSNLRAKWEQAAGHMQAAARQQQGYAVVTMKVLVGPSGDPVLWYEPCVRKMSPLTNSKLFIGQLVAAAEQESG